MKSILAPQMKFGRNCSSSLLLLTALLVLSGPMIAGADSISQTKLVLVGDAGKRDWAYESFVYELSSPDGCQSGKSLTFLDSGIVVDTRCISKKLDKRELTWMLERVESHHVILKLSKGKTDERFLVQIRPKNSTTGQQNIDLLHRGDSTPTFLMKKLSLFYTAIPE